MKDDFIVIREAEVPELFAQLREEIAEVTRDIDQMAKAEWCALMAYERVEEFISKRRKRYEDEDTDS